MFIPKTNEVDYYAGVQAYASAMKPVWPLIDQALLHPNCKFRIMNDESTPYMNNSLFKFVPLQESLRSVARLADHDGDFARAQSMLQKSVRMIGQLKQPSLESLLARQRMSSATLDELDKEIQESGGKGRNCGSSRQRPWTQYQVFQPCSVLLRFQYRSNDRSSSIFAITMTRRPTHRCSINFNGTPSVSKSCGCRRRPKR